MRLTDRGSVGANEGTHAAKGKNSDGVLGGQREIGGEPRQWPFDRRTRSELSNISHEQNSPEFSAGRYFWRLFWLVWIYSNGLRDPRYLDGWVLAGGISFQLYFHIAIKTASLSPKSLSATRKAHIFTGYLLIAAFVSHSDFSLPDTGFEWALWACFVLVTLSGIFGAYLAWSLRAKRELDDSVGYDRLSARRSELAQDVHAVVVTTGPAAAAFGLPASPDDAWIMDLYANHLRYFFEDHRNITAHLIGSRRPLQRLTDEIDDLSRYVDKQSQEKLAAIRAFVVEKDRLDFAHVHLALTKGWLFVHVPATYSLIVLTVLHIIVAYAFSSGDW